MSLVGKLFSFHGRLSRLDWWALALGLNVVGAALTAVLSASFATPGATIDGSANAVRDWVAIAVAAALLWPSLAITVKRRHDRGGSGWLAAAVFTVLTALNTLPLLYFALSVFGFEKAGWWGAAAAFVIPAALWLALLVLLGILPGDPGGNRYGPSPLKPPPDGSEVRP